MSKILKNATLAAFTLVMAVPSGTREASTDAEKSVEPPRWNAKVRLLATETAGPTAAFGSASRALNQGETGRLFISAGQLEGLGQACGTRTASAHPVNSEATQKMRERTLALAGDGVSWDLTIRLVDAGRSSAQIDLSWHRRHSTGGSSTETVHQQQLTLETGERRLLEVVPFSPPNTDPSCAVVSHALELQLTPAPVADLAGQDLRYSLWFASSQQKGREEFGSTELLGGQAEELTFTLPRLSRPLKGVKLAGTDEHADVETQCKGTVRAWAIGPNRVGIQINPALHHFLVPGMASFSSGEGSKHFEAKLGETIELQLPVTSAGLIIPTNHLEIDEAAPGISRVSADAFRWDFGAWSEGKGFSLFVRVDAAEGH